MAEAYARRRKRELEALGAVIAVGANNPKKLGKLVREPVSRLHGAPRRGGDLWWRRGGG